MAPWLGALLLVGCGETAQLPFSAGTGPQPALPEPHPTLIPTVNIAPAIGWPPGLTPQAAPGMQVTAFATGLEHPRWLLVLPNGDVLVAESNAPAKPEDGLGIKGWVMGLVMNRAGAGVPSADRITVLRDIDGDGVADLRSVLLHGLSSPFGMTLIGDTLYVANSNAVVKFPYASGDLRITADATHVVELPAGPINHHWTKNIIASVDGSKLYVTVGSNSNVGERGMAAEADRAAIWEVNLSDGAHRVYASGLRNPNGMAWELGTGGGTTAPRGAATTAMALYTLPICPASVPASRIASLTSRSRVASSAAPRPPPPSSSRCRRAANPIACRNRDCVMGPCTATACALPPPAPPAPPGPPAAPPPPPPPAAPSATPSASAAKSTSADRSVSPGAWRTSTKPWPRMPRSDGRPVAAVHSASVWP